jgi:hypothetical protein
MEPCGGNPQVHHIGEREKLLIRAWEQWDNSLELLLFMGAQMLLSKYFCCLMLIFSVFETRKSIAWLHVQCVIKIETIIGHWLIICLSLQDPSVFRKNRKITTFKLWKN